MTILASSESRASNSAINYAKFVNQKGNFSEVISRQENKFFAVKPLYALAALQIIFGAFILIVQVKQKNVIHLPLF